MFAGREADAEQALKQDLAATHSRLLKQKSITARTQI